MSGVRPAIPDDTIGKLPKGHAFEKLSSLIGTAAGCAYPSAALLDALALTNAIIRALGECPDTYEFSPYPDNTVSIGQMPFRSLTKAKACLTISRADEECCEKNAALPENADVRLLKPLLYALGREGLSSMAKRLICEWGRQTLPYLIKNFDCKADTLRQVRLLELIEYFEGKDAFELYSDVFNNGAFSLKKLALELYFKHSRSYEFLVAASADKRMLPAVCDILAKDNSAPAEQTLLAIAKAAGSESSVPVISLCSRKDMSGECVAYLAGLDLMCLDDFAFAHCLNALGQAACARTDICRMFERNPAAVTWYCCKTCSPEHFFRCCASKERYIYARNVILTCDYPKLHENWYEYFISIGDGTAVARTARAGNAAAAAFLSAFDISVCGQTGLAAELLVFGVYPLTLLQMEIYDFWENLANRLDEYISGQISAHGHLSEAFFSPQMMNILAVNGDWLADRLEESAASAEVSAWLNGIRARVSAT